MYESEEEYNDAMQGQAEYDAEQEALNAEGEAEQARIEAERSNEEGGKQ